MKNSDSFDLIIEKEKEGFSNVLIVIGTIFMTFLLPFLILYTPYPQKIIIGLISIIFLIIVVLLFRRFILPSILISDGHIRYEYCIFPVNLKTYNINYKFQKTIDKKVNYNDILYIDTISEYTHHRQYFNNYKEKLFDRQEISEVNNILPFLQKSDIILIRTKKNLYSSSSKEKEYIEFLMNLIRKIQQ